jgi:predicted  nucleic acid-binding Zn-ribbon protein
MADLEARVALLEREFSNLKAKVADHDAELQNIPDLIKTESRFTNSKIDRLARRFDTLESRFDTLESRFETLEAKVDALPRAMAEIVKELLEKKSR